MTRTFTNRIQGRPTEAKPGRARQKAEPFARALRKSEIRSQLAYDSLEAVTAGAEALIAVVDPQLRYTFFNRVYQEEIRRLTGKNVQVGDSVEELLAHMPEQREVAVREWRRTLLGENRSYRTEFGDLPFIGGRTAFDAPLFGMRPAT